jgi:probable rRNA maturation factor
MRVEVSYGLARRGLPAPLAFGCWIDRTGRILDVDGVVSIRVAGAVEGAALNRRFRHLSGPTNVLSFPAAPPGRGERFWGDIVLCGPVVTAEAKSFGRPPRHHFAHLTVHGFLHLLGYDHERPESRRLMETLEIRLLGGLGIPDPYEERPPGRCSGSR